jgi:GTP-binding protein HflX
MSKPLYETAEQPKRAFLLSLEDAAELRSLAETLELDVVGCETLHLREKHPRYGMGSGKAVEIAQRAAELQADCVIFDWDISPS